MSVSVIELDPTGNVAGTSKPKVPVGDLGISEGPCTTVADSNSNGSQSGGGGSQVGSLTKSLQSRKWLRPLVAPSCRLSLVVNSRNMGSVLSTTLYPAFAYSVRAALFSTSTCKYKVSTPRMLARNSTDSNNLPPTPRRRALGLTATSVIYEMACDGLRNPRIVP